MNQTILTYNIPTPKKHVWKWILIFGIIFFLVAGLAILFSPAIAHAEDYPWGWGGVLEWPKTIQANLNGALISGINEDFVNMCTTVKDIDTHLLTANWNELLGGSSIYNWITGITNTVIKPIAATILSVVLLMQLLKISSKADSQGTMPVVKEVMFLIIFMAVFIYIISNCDHICCAIYEAVLSICKGIQQSGQATPTPTQDFIGSTPGNAANWSDKDLFASLDLGKVIPFWLVFLLGKLLAFVAGIISMVMIIARGLQLYIYSTFSPIPMSLLGFEETRSWGVGYFKSFAAIALSGAFLLIIIYAMPYLFATIYNGVDIGQAGLVNIEVFKRDSALGDGLKYAGYAMAALIVYIMGILKSGSWAKELLGS